MITIPDGTYRGQKGERQTWGLPATVLASANADDEVIYYLVKVVFDNFEDLKKQSALYTGITREGAVDNGRTAPYHPAALKYYEEGVVLYSGLPGAGANRFPSIALSPFVLLGGLRCRLNGRT